MPNTTTTTANCASEAVRFAEDASRRTVEQTQASLSIARSYLDEVAALGRAVFATWGSAAEAGYTNASQFQNAALAAASAVYDAASQTGRLALNQWTSLA